MITERMQFDLRNMVSYEGMKFDDGESRTGGQSI
jgi:hypothetical protein